MWKEKKEILVEVNDVTYSTPSMLAIYPQCAVHYTHARFSRIKTTTIHAHVCEHTQLVVHSFVSKKRENKIKQNSSMKIMW